MTLYPQTQKLQPATRVNEFGLVDTQVIEKLEIVINKQIERKTPSTKTINKEQHKFVAERQSFKQDFVKSTDSIYPSIRSEIPKNEGATDKCVVWENNEFNGLFNDVHIIVENFYASVKDYKVIGITSAQQNEGSSTVLSLIAQMISAKQDSYYWSNLSSDMNKSALSVNQLQKRSNLLIDTQFMNPNLHKTFQVGMTPGLYDFMSNGIALRDVIRDISMSLKLIPLGDKSKYAFPKFNVEKLEFLLEYVKPQYEYIFLDIPPILSYPEAITLSKLCDGVVLVVHARKTRWEIIHEAHRMLERVGVNVIGSILNKRKFYIPQWFYDRL